MPTFAVVGSYREMQDIEAPQDGDSVLCLGRWTRSDGPQKDYGGGMFWFDADRDKSDHDGGVYISPTVPPIETDRSNNGAFLDGEGETDENGEGIWRRIYDESEFIHVDWYGRDESALRKAITSWNKVLMGPGVTYELTGVIRSQSRDLHIRVNGAIVRQMIGNDEGGLILAGGWEDVQPIVSQNNSASSGYPYVYVDQPMEVVRGDIVKLGANRDSEAFVSCQDGEFKAVYGEDVGATKIQFNSPTDFSYQSDSPYIGRLRQDKIIVEGPGRFEFERGADNDSEVQRTGLIQIASALNPLVHSLDFPFHYYDGLEFYSCYGAVARDLNFQYAPSMGDEMDFEGSGFLGYGIRITNSYGTLCDNIQGRLMRHLIVSIGSGGNDGITGGDEGGGMSGYGFSQNTRIQGCHGTDCITATFDTHHGSMDTYFFNCSSSNCKGAGFSARGIGVRFFNCVSTGDGSAFHAFVQNAYRDGSAITNGVTWNGGQIIRPTRAGYRIDAYATNVKVLNTELTDLGDVPEQSS